MNKRGRKKRSRKRREGEKRKTERKKRKSSDEVEEEKKKVNVRMCPIMTSISSSESFLSRQFQRG